MLLRGWIYYGNVDLARLPSHTDIFTLCSWNVDSAVMNEDITLSRYRRPNSKELILRLLDPLLRNE